MFPVRSQGACDPTTCPAATLSDQVYPFRAALQETSGWAADVDMQCFCLLKLAIKTELHSVNVA